MKKLFAVSVIVMLLLTAFLLFSTDAISEFGEEGYAMPDHAGVLQSLSAGEEGTAQMVSVGYEDTVYVSRMGYFVGEERSKIDKGYPVYINGGAGLRFLNEENWLISSEIDIVQSFEGLYLNNGITYNSDMTQADAEEFILLALKNGLYMNAQHAIFTNRIGSVDIPTNSILCLSETAIRWYSLENQSLVYGEEEAVFDAVLTIGEHSYSYGDLLEALGLIRKAIEKAENNQNYDKELEQAWEILEDEEVERGSKPGSSEIAEESGTIKETEERQEEEEGTDQEGSKKTEGSEGSGTGEEPKGNDASSDDGDTSRGDTDQGSGNKGDNDGSGSAGSAGDSASGEDGTEQGKGDSVGDTTGEGNTDGGSQGGEEDGNQSEGGGGSGVVAYQDPVVTLTGLEPWCYAIKGTVTITDPANTVVKGARITAYRRIGQTGLLGGAGKVNEEGYMTYPAEDYVGKSALLRKTYASSQDFALSTLPPDTTVYLQLSYRYNAQFETTDPDTGETIKVVERKTVLSDFIEVKTLENGSIAPVAAEWTEVFAANDKEMCLEGLTLANTSDYDSELETFDFENFKKNTLNYINRLEFTLTPADGGESVILNTSSSVIRNAKTENGAVFTSSGGKLKADTVYTYEVKARDRYGNEMPFQKGQGYTGTLYTRKSEPVVKIEEVENVPDKLTLRFTVSDPCGALLQEKQTTEALKLSIFNNQEEAIGLYGFWKNGEPFGNVNDPESCMELLLTEPQDGAVYELTMESLAFDQTYTIQVLGSYDLQPTKASEPKLGVAENVQLGIARCYTASLSNGSIQFQAAISNVKDTGVTLSFAMTRSTSMDILPMVDTFCLSLTEKESGRQAAGIELTPEELDVYLEESNYSYDEESHTVVIQKDDIASGMPKVELVGSKEQFAGKTLWEALQIDAYPDSETGEPVYTSPVQLRVTMPDGTLKTSTAYLFEMESLVFKSGITYEIPTSLTTDHFTTKKIQPVLDYEDFFVAGDVVEFLNLQIYDPDETIQNEGLVYVNLYYGDILLSVDTLHAVQDASEARTTLHFDDIMKGADYTITFVASAYNDGEGATYYETNRLLWSYSFQGGSMLSGTLNLNSLNYTYNSQNAAKVFEDLTLTGSEIEEKIQTGAWKEINTDYYETEACSIPEEATFLLLDDYQYQNNHTKGCFFYDSNGKLMKWGGRSELFAGKEKTLLVGVPKGAYSVRFRLPGKEYMTTHGVQVKYYTTEQKNLLNAETVKKNYSCNVNTGDEVESSSYDLYPDKIPVQEGDVYHATGYLNDLFLWSKDKAYIGRINVGFHAMLVIPKEVGYISCTYQTGNTASNGLYKVSEAEVSSGYRAEVSVSVIDKGGYLAKESDTPQATIQLYRSHTINEAQYDATPYLSQKVELEKLEDGSWSKEYAELLQHLTPDCGWKMTLSIEYQGDSIVLDSITFQTDGAYFTISNQWEFAQINSNPYANYIVVEDFSWDSTACVSTLYGTIDFQGHVITREENASYLIRNMIYGSVLRNLVVDVPAGTTYTNPLIDNNTGTIENLVFRTEGIVNQHASALVSRINSGVLRNFIVKLGGDLYVKSLSEGARYGVLVSMHNQDGVIEDGYVYGVDAAGIIFLPNDIGTYRAGLIETTNGIVQNIYTIFDSWYNTTPEYQNYVVHIETNRLRNFYHVGDFYQLSTSGIKSYAARTEAEHFTSGENTWHISKHMYRMHGTESLHGEPIKLKDTQWQQKILGDAFDAEKCIEMGFYPRLKLSAVMQKYQEYLSLPTLESMQLPELVSDDWAFKYEKGHDNEFGNILLRFRNDRGYSIQDVTIDGLQVTAVDNIGITADGLYDVVLTVTAEEYKSAYNVLDYTYNNGSASEAQSCDYTTKIIEFWKEVADVQEWKAIDENLSWNYRLVSDLNFSGSSLTAGEIQINGSTTEPDREGGSKVFTGKLDGGQYNQDGELTGIYALKGIELLERNLPAVIDTIQDASVTNLIVENMTLSASSAANHTRSGFVGTATSSTLDNIHVRDSKVHGIGDMGLLIGYGNKVQIKNSSAADSVLEDVKASISSYAGGLAGSISYSHISSCYVRECDLNISRSAVVGVGGLLGYSSGRSSITNSYTSGTIKVIGSNVGGLLGNKSATAHCTLNCWTDTELDVTGSIVGGISGVASGAEESFERHLLVAGDIRATGDEIHRVQGKGSTLFSGRVAYAYAEQKVTKLEKGNVDDAKALLTTEELQTKAAWADVIQIGSGWDISPVTEGAFPKVYREDGAGLVWGQEDIFLPGVGGKQKLEVLPEETGYNEEEGYYVTVRWSHESYSTAQIQEWITKEGIEGPSLNISLDGMNVNNDEISFGTASVTVSPGEEENCSYLRITSKFYSRAFDRYLLSVAYGNHVLTEEIDFGFKVYHEVPDLATWKALMEEGHDKTKENFMITGMIDFQDTLTSYTELEIGNLVGRKDETGNEVGFCNLVHEGSQKGAPWIESITGDMDGLILKNISGIFTDVSETYQRNATGLILSAGNVKNCEFRNITINCNYYSMNSVGIFSTITSCVDNVTMKRIKVQSNPGWETGGTYSRAGGLAANLGGSFSGITADDVTVNVGNVSTGGLFGVMTSTASVTGEDAVLQNLKVSGYTAYGISGGSLNAQFANITLENSVIQGQIGAAGICYLSRDKISGITVRNTDIRNVLDTGATQHAAGIAYQINYGSSMNNVLIDRVNICGTDYASGLVVSTIRTDLSNVQVLNSEIIAQDKAGDTDNTMVAGVLCSKTLIEDSSTIARCTVRNTKIMVDPTYREVGSAAGILGTAYKTTMNNCYVAEDVRIITSGTGYAGGIIGKIELPMLTNVACGAIIDAYQYAGGIIGILDWSSNAQSASLKQVYYRGDVSASNNFAGGIIGALRGDSLLTTANLDGVLVAANVSSGGRKASLWANKDTTLDISPGNGNVQIWDQSVANGQTAGALQAMAESVGSGLAPIPAGGKLLSAEEFRKADTYTQEGFTTGNWDMTDLSTYMPFVKGADGKVLPGANSRQNENGDTVAAGILQPELGNVNPQETKVYASGADTVNIELGSPASEKTYDVTINGNAYSVKAASDDITQNGVLTLSYDFKTDLTIDSVTYPAEELRRSVMIYGDYWYYIDKGSLYYGTDVQGIGKPVIEGIGTPIHLWQGKVLCENGTVYRLEGSVAVQENTVSTITPLEAAEPFYTKTVTRAGKKIQIDVYHDFTIYDKKVVEQRIFEQSGTLYAVSPYQGMLYDGVMLSIQDDGVNEVKYYYALLSEEGEEGTGGKLTNYAAGWVTQEFRTDGIEHISGNFGSDRTVILAKYTDGTIVGYDYAAEQLLFTTADMVTYARMSLRSLFRSAFNPGVTSDPNYMGVLAEGNATAAGDTEAIGNNSGPFVNQEAEASGTGGVLEGGSNPIEGTTAVSGDVAAAGSGNDEGGSGVTGSAMSNGSAASDGHAISNSDAAGDGSVDSKDTKTGSSKEPVNFVSGTGTTGSTEVTGTGRGTGTGNGNGGGGTSRNEEQQLAEVGNMVVYDPISGRYLSVEAKDLLTGAGDAEATHQLLSEQEANQNTQEEEQEKTDMDEDTFKIGTGVGRVLDEENRGGFVMLGILAAAVGCLLIILYVKSVRKKQ